MSKKKTSKKYFRGIRAINLAYSDEDIEIIANKLADKILGERKKRNLGGKKK